MCEFLGHLCANVLLVLNQCMLCSYFVAVSCLSAPTFALGGAYVTIRRLVVCGIIICFRLPVNHITWSWQWSVNLVRTSLYCLDNRLPSRCLLELARPLSLRVQADRGGLCFRGSIRTLVLSQMARLSWGRRFGVSVSSVQIDFVSETGYLFSGTTVLLRNVVLRGMELPWFCPDGIVRRLRQAASSSLPALLSPWPKPSVQESHARVETRVLSSHPTEDHWETPAEFQRTLWVPPPLETPWSSTVRVPENAVSATAAGDVVVEYRWGIIFFVAETLVGCVVPIRFKLARWRVRLQPSPFDGPTRQTFCRRPPRRNRRIAGGSRRWWTLPPSTQSVKSGYVDTATS